MRLNEGTEEWGKIQNMWRYSPGMRNLQPTPGLLDQELWEGSSGACILTPHQGGDVAIHQV